MEKEAFPEWTSIKEVLVCNYASLQRHLMILKLVNEYITKRVTELNMDDIQDLANRLLGHNGLIHQIRQEIESICNRLRKEESK